MSAMHRLQLMSFWFLLFSQNMDSLPLKIWLNILNCIGLTWSLCSTLIAELYIYAQYWGHECNCTVTGMILICTVRWTSYIYHSHHVDLSNCTVLEVIKNDQCQDRRISLSEYIQPSVTRYYHSITSLSVKAGTNHRSEELTKDQSKWSRWDTITYTNEWMMEMFAMATHKIYAMTPIDQQSTALP